MGGARRVPRRLLARRQPAARKAVGFGGGRRSAAFASASAAAAGILRRARGRLRRRGVGVGVGLRRLAGAGAARRFERFLLKPGPDVFVWTRRTATSTTTTRSPLQNNLIEYFHMVNFVNPGKLGTLDTFKKLFVEHMAQFAARGVGDEQRRRAAMDKRVFTLAKKLDNLVQRRGMEILSRTLPPRYDVVVTVRLSEVQRRLYNAAIARTTNKKVFSFQHTMRRIFDHPAMLLLHERSAKPGSKRAAAAAPAAAAARLQRRRRRARRGRDRPAAALVGGRVADGGAQPRRRSTPALGQGLAHLRSSRRPSRTMRRCCCSRSRSSRSRCSRRRSRTRRRHARPAASAGSAASTTCDLTAPSMPTSAT